MSWLSHSLLLALSLLPTEQQTVVLLPQSPSAAKTYFPIPVEHLEEEFRIRSADDGKLFREEYNVSRRLQPTSVFIITVTCDLTLDIVMSW